MIKGDILLKNNTGITPKEVLIDGFVIRNQEYEFILNSLLNGFSNFFIVGQRGSGKTYLLHRLKYGIEDNEVLSQSIIPIIYSEEQYYLSDLIDLWESVFDYLEEKEGWRGIKKLKGELSEDPFAYENELTKILILKLEESKKHIYLLVENLNVFFKKIGKVGQQRLKQILTESEVIHLIGASTAVNDGNNDFGSSFYDFLKIIYLKGLTKYECSKLLIKIGQQYGKEDEIKFIIKKTPGRIESLRRLTGGVPRTISYLFQIFLDNENGKAIKDLYQLIDSLTNLYKSELDGLSTQQQKIIDIIARNWDAISVRDIVKLTRYESKNVSSLLSTLEKNQIIEVIQTRNKNNLYRIKERFLNIWYLMRFGKKHDRENVIWLVRFFDAWCDKSELAKRVADHINQLEGGNFDLNAAIDMGNTFLSCQNISESLKYLLYTTTQSVLPDKMKKKLRISDSVLYKKISELMEDANFDKAFSILNEVEDKGTVYESFLSWFHLMRGEIDESIKSGKKVLDLEPHNPLAAISLGIIYQDYYRDIENAEYYLKLALQYGHPYAGTRLGDIAYYFRGDLETAQTYHQQAIKKNFKTSYLHLADIFNKEGKVTEALQFCNEAIDNKVSGAFKCMAKIYQNIGDPVKVVEYYRKAIEHKEKNAYIDFGLFYLNKKKPNFEKAKSYFETAILNNQNKAYSLLGKMYLRNFRNEEKALEVLNKGVAENDAQSAHSLGHYFDNKKEFELADKYFIKSFEMGLEPSMFCLVNAIYENKRKDKKEFALDFLNRHVNIINKYPEYGSLVYARTLLWNNKVNDALDIFTRELSIYDSLKKFDTDVDESALKIFVKNVTDFLLLLLAKEEYDLAYSLFEGEHGIELKTRVKPVYFLLMLFMKQEFPNEYLKAGEELNETITEMKKIINELKTIVD